MRLRSGMIDFLLVFLQTPCSQAFEGKPKGALLPNIKVFATQFRLNLVSVLLVSLCRPSKRGSLLLDTVMLQFSEPQNPCQPRTNHPDGSMELYLPQVIRNSCQTGHLSKSRGAPSIPRARSRPSRSRLRHLRKALGGQTHAEAHAGPGSLARPTAQPKPSPQNVAPPTKTRENVTQENVGRLGPGPLSSFCGKFEWFPACPPFIAKMFQPQTPRLCLDPGEKDMRLLHFRSCCLPLIHPSFDP